MNMPSWFKEEMMNAFRSKDVYLIVELNKSWNEYLKKFDESKK